MAIEAHPVAPKAPFVVITRKGGFPAATKEEALRLARPLVGDDKASITDANGTKYAPRHFLDACETAPAAAPTQPRDIKDWAAATADIDLHGGAPAGWSPPIAPSAPPASPATAARSSGRSRAPASTRSSASNAAARARSTSDRRPSGERRRRGDDGTQGISPITVILIIATIVLAGVVIAVIGNRSPAPAPQANPAPAASPNPMTPTGDGTIRPQDRPLPTYMRD